jgi:hypothetical protein
MISSGRGADWVAIFRVLIPYRREVERNPWRRDTLEILSPIDAARRQDFILLGVARCVMATGQNAFEIRSGRSAVRIAIFVGLISYRREVERNRGYSRLRLGV